MLAAGQMEHAARYADALQAMFGDRLYVELSRRGEAIEMQAEAALVDLAYARGLPLVATNPAQFAEPAMHAAHDVLLCIAGGAYVDSNDRVASNPENWVKPTDAMARLFDDLPEALSNTLAIAQRCGVAPPKRKPILPSLAGDTAAEEAQLRRDARAGLDARLARREGLSEAERRRYVDRLNYEIDIIAGMGFPGYFLIVADFIKWAKARDIPVGPGRGSGAGSLVAWALTITDIDPLPFGLLFERFLNPERVSMPDFDIDFCEVGRGEVIRYVQEKYGRDTVAQIISFGTMKARAVLKDTGRVLQMSYGQVDRLAKLVPSHPTDPWTLTRALEGGEDKEKVPHGPVPELVQACREDDGVRHLMTLARALEGLPRHASTHAAGVVIGDRPLDRLVPLYRDPRSDMAVTQFDMKFCEAAGLVKFDFLGLKTLSVLKEACRLLALRGIDVALDSLSWDDPAVFSLLQRGDTVGVFQLESDGMRRTLASVKPSCFADIIALVSLYRPGPMDNIPLFADRKNGRQPVEYPHPLLKDILEETYGIFVYQEQVMQAAQVLAGYSLGGADLLRRAMGKKDQQEMAKQRVDFVEGCAKKSGIPADKANDLFDVIDKFAGYGFNKSHAAAYSVISYQTAWMKVHYPHEFYAASMTFDSHATDKLAVFVSDMRRSGLTVLPPCINASEPMFSVESHGDGLALRYALGAIRGVGEKAMEALVAERTDKGAFVSLDDFAARLEPQWLNRRQIEALAGAGAFDALDADRASLFGAAEAMTAMASANQSDRQSGQGGLFGQDMASAQLHFPRVPPWPLAKRLLQEKEAFGFYFSGHPVDQFQTILMARKVVRHDALLADESLLAGQRRRIGMAGLVEGLRWRTSQRGNRFAIVALSDASGPYEARCFDALACEMLEDMSREGSCGLFAADVDRGEDDGAVSIAIRSVQSISLLAARATVQLMVKIYGTTALAALAQTLPQSPSARGRVIVLATAPETGTTECFDLGDGFVIDGSVQMLVGNLPGVIAADISLIDDAALRDEAASPDRGARWQGYDKRR